MSFPIMVQKTLVSLPVDSLQSTNIETQHLKYGNEHMGN